MTIVTITRPVRQKIIEERADQDGDIMFKDAENINEGLINSNAGTVNNTNIVTPGELVTDETTWMR